MSLSSILQKIQSKGQIKTHPSQTAAAPPPAVQAKATVNPSTERAVDPVVARLKAARKAEREAKEQAARAKKGVAARKPARPRAPKTAAAPASSRATQAPPKPVGAPAEKKAKMSFSELMKKASSIDQSKMSIDIKRAKTPELRKERKTPEPRRALDPRGASQPRKASERRAPQPSGPRGDSRNASRREDAGGRPKAQNLRPAAGPLPMRQPSAKLQSRLQKRTVERPHAAAPEDDDSDMGSFIASDEEEQVSYGQGYDREEIWSMFNRGNKRLYYDRYDSDSDDMEATGAEIFEEEALSKRHAVEDDRRELEEEQRRAALKLARRKRT